MKKVELVFATHNPNKAHEIQKMFSPSIPLKIKTLSDIGCFEDIPENQPDLEGNALQKVRFVQEKFGCNCFADDTGLEVDALNGLPGVMSARFAGPEKDSEKNIDLVLERLGDNFNRKAKFRTIIALIWNDKEYLFEGKCEGNILKYRKGSNGFGYDSIFEPENCGKTFAEMELNEKNDFSHRSRAFKKLIHFLEKTHQN